MKADSPSLIGQKKSILDIFEKNSPIKQWCNGAMGLNTVLMHCMYCDWTEMGLAVIVLEMKKTL